MTNTDTGHGTHVTGTVMGRGAYPSPNNTHACGDVTTPLPDARGMAHGAQVVHNNIFDGGIGSEAAMMTWQSQQGAVVNNNSWGYGSIFGPATDYGSQTVAVDAAVRNADPGGSINAQMAIVFAAGNSAAQGVSKPGNGKNVITVGASQNDRCGAYIPSECAGPDIDGMACFSSQGPSQQRIKPDIVAPGTDIISSESSDPQATHPWDQPWTGPHLSTSPGTSMSSPVVTGAAVLFMEHYQTTFGQLPSPALVKAALINTATDIGLGFPSNVQGWGRLNLLKAIEGPVEDGIVLFDQDEVDHLTTGQSWTTEVVVGSSDEPLRLTLAWTDPPGSSGCSVCHINDLDLVVTAPDGTIYRGNQFSNSWSQPNAGDRDSINNVENVFIELPASGEYTVEVIAHSVAQNPNLLSGQDFALVITGDLGGLSVDPGTIEACMADGSVDFTLTLSGQFEGSTHLSADTIPTGTSGSFSVNPVVFPADQSVYTLDDLDLAAAGAHVLEFSAVDADDSGIFDEADASLSLYSAVPQGHDLLTPPDQTTGTVLRPEFNWSAASEATSYRIQIAVDEAFGTILIDEVLDETSFVPASDLATGTRHYWRVNSNNVCGDGAWSEVFEFQTRFEPIAEVAPLSFAFELPQNGLESQALTIANVGTGNLLWSIETDEMDAGLLAARGHDPALDEIFELGDFSLPGHASAPPPVVFEVPAGLISRGEVTGFSFAGTAAPPGTAWASDTCMIVEAPDGTSYGVGGYSSYAPHCGPGHRDAEWDFQGDGSSDEGSYASEHDDAFATPLEDEGMWTFTFVNAWLSGTAGTTQWTDVAVTLHKQPLPVCVEDLSDVPWLSTSPESGSVAAGSSDEVSVQVNASGMDEGDYLAWLCLTTNAEGQELITVPVELTVTEMVVGQLSLDKTALSFGEVTVGQPVSDTITVSNTAPQGAPDIELADIVLDDSDSWSTTGSCQLGTVLSPGEECTVEVEFNPVTTGPLSSTLTVSTVLGQSASASLDGTGVQEPAELLIDPLNLDFGTVAIANSAVQAITISNTAPAAAADLPIAQIELMAGAPDYAISTNDCPASLAPEHSCTVEVRFVPNGPGLRLGVLRIVADGQTSNLSLSGSGIEPEPIIFEDRFEN